MQLKTLHLIVFVLLSATLSAQITFTNQTKLLNPVNHFSGVAIGVLDMNGDGRDDIVRMNQGFQLAIEYQTGPGQPFQHQFIENLKAGSQWGMCVADVDNNGIPDILAGGFYDGIKVAMANSDGSEFTVLTLNEPPTFTQGVNFADINNDGWVDAFICHDDSVSRIFINDGIGTLVYSPQTINLNSKPLTDNSGNYGSVWSDVDNDGDLDLYIAKCRTGINNPNDGRRINQLFLNNGDGTYSQDTSNISGLRIGAQSWTADFADIDNDGDFDCFVTNHDVSSQLLENDGAGHFTDITDAAGLFNAILALPIQGVFRDFDNDGFVDLLVAGSDHYLFKNNGDKTFTQISILDENPMESFALGDLNADGFQDIYGIYAELFTDPGTIPDALWINEGNDNHYFGLNLQGVQSNRSAIGTKVLLYSALGIQTREVRSGESYGIMNSTQVHFGMGQHTQIDSVVIHWPSGLSEVVADLAVDQILTVVEGTCVVPPVLAYASGSTVFCSGDSVEIAVPGAFASYAWNTGATSAMITVKDAGQYFVTVTTAEGCTVVSNPVAIVVDPVETPSIFPQSDTVFCAGGSVLLEASPASSYLWTTGETTPSIEVNTSGFYAVITQGLCAQFTSAPQQVTVLDAPLPVPVSDTVALGSVATLTATGDELIWYDAPAGGNILYTGDPFKTPPLQESTQYWVANIAIYDQPNVFTGMTDHMGSNFAGPQTNGQIIFDCLDSFRLVRVYVYASKAGVRKIDLKDADENLLKSVSADIPVGISFVDLNFDIPVGNGLRLTTDPVVNQQTLGTNGPQLRRSDQGINYPYVVPAYLSINTSNYGSQFYYYFYDWEIDLPGHECLSERVPVMAIVDSSLVQAPDLLADESIRIYPNPSNGNIHLALDDFSGGVLEWHLCDARGRGLQFERMELIAGPQVLPLDLGNLASGVYFITVTTRDGLVRQKITVGR